MGNRLCKKKTDVIDGTSVKSHRQTPFDRIINRLHLRPTSWKSDSYLNQKQVNRAEVSSKNPSDKPHTELKQNQLLSKSSDWTDVSLEVPDKEDHIHLRNPKLEFIFNHEDGTPTPPPRKHKKNFREKIEAVAKNGLQALQSKKSHSNQQQQPSNQQPVEEAICIKKKINYSCPLCDSDEKNHNRDHHHTHVVPNPNNINPDKNRLNLQKQHVFEKHKDKTKKDLKRKKNLSVISLPNYNELKLTIVNFEDIDKNSKNIINDLQRNSNKKFNASTGKLDGYIARRCRSFGSLFPQNFKKIKSRKVPADIESDDSFGGLEEWDLGLIEHYNPKDASLPRIRKLRKSDKAVLAGIEDLVVNEADIEPAKPVPPIRHSESLLKKINKEASQTAQQRLSQQNYPDTMEISQRSNNMTPPPSPVPRKPTIINEPTAQVHNDNNGVAEHSSLMRILQEFSMSKAANTDNKSVKPNVEDLKQQSDDSSLTPSLVEFERNLNLNSIEEFINAEKNNTDVFLPKHI